MTHAVSRPFLVLAACLSLVFSGPALAGEPPPPGSVIFMPGAGVFHRFDSDLEREGSFSVFRVGAGFAATLIQKEGKSAGISLDYGRLRYDFSSGRGLFGDSPWENIQTFGISFPVRVTLSSGTRLMAAPSLRISSEEGATQSGAFSGGGFVGCARRFSDRLTFGPGIAFRSEFKDSPMIFPFPFLDFSLSENLSLATGRGFAATAGPGLVLEYRPASGVTLYVGGRYERMRFRLDETGAAPGGIGQDSSAPLFAGIRYERGQRFRAEVLAGVHVFGELELSDFQGYRLSKEDVDPAPLVGLVVAGQF